LIASAITTTPSVRKSKLVPIRTNAKRLFVFASLHLWAC
jgi:hypothetical protein